MRKVPQAAVDLVMKFEGLRCTAYPDPGTGAEPWTIGYGTTGDKVHPGLVITPEVAEDWLCDGLEATAREVLRIVPVPLNDNEFSALISFAYNVGAGNLQTSTLLKKLKAHDYAGAADEFPRWNRAAGKVLPGLIARRAAERDLFLKKDATDVRN